MPKNLHPALTAGLLSSGLFLLVAVTGLGVFFVFLLLPVLPLLNIGFSSSPRLALYGALIAGGIIAVLAGPPAAILFLLFIGLPAWYITRQSLLWRAGNQIQPEQWFPVGLILMHLTLYACAIVALITLNYAGQPGGLPQLLSQHIHQAFSDLQDEYGDVIDMLASTWSFMVFASTIWLWCLSLYGYAWLANHALSRKGRTSRPAMSIEVFPMPDWMLGLLGICALASLIGSESMSFLGKSTMISLMLPYFFLGIALMHSISASWQNRRFFLFFIYLLIITLFWPALCLSGVGVWHHLRTFNKRLSSGGTSFKS